MIAGWRTVVVKKKKMKENIGKLTQRVHLCVGLMVFFFSFFCANLYVLDSPAKANDFKGLLM